MKKHVFIEAAAIVFCLQLLCTSKSFAQAAVNSDVAKLKSFTGKYQFVSDKSVFLQILVKDGQLVLKQLWDNEEIPFKQTSVNEFYNDEHSFPLKFTKNDAGEAMQVLAFNRDVWNKVADDYIYKPTLQKTIQLTAGQLKSFEGKYQLKNGDGDADDFLQITATTDHLILTQLWDKREITFSAVSALDFVNDDQKFPLRFTKDSNGAVIQLLAFNRDIWMKTK